MNSRQLIKAGVPEDCVKDAIACIQIAMQKHDVRKVKNVLKALVENPEQYTTDRYYGNLAKSIVEDSKFVRPDPVA